MARRKSQTVHAHAYPHNGYMMALFAGALMLFSTFLSATGGASITGFAIADDASGLHPAAAVGVGFLIGLAVLGSATMMREPGKHKYGGGIAAVFSIAALLTGVGFILGGLAGLVAAVFAIGNI